MCDPSSEFVDFRRELMKSGGDPDVYNKERIVVRQIGKYPEGTLVKPFIMTLNTIYNIFLHEENEAFLRFLLGLINSKLFQFYWFKKFYDNKATFPKIKKGPLESLPIKEPTNEIVGSFSSLVNTILETKKQSPSADTTHLESQIDQLVYQLYDLTEEEIAIVENA